MKLASISLLTAALFTVPPVVAQEQSKTEIFTFWSTAGEQKALSVYVDAMNASGMNLNIVVAESYDEMREQMAERIALDLVPNFSHWLWGADLLSLADATELIPLSDNIDGRPVTELIFQDIIPDISRDGEIMAIPVGTHLQSVTLSNMNVLSSVGRDAMPSTWPELFELADELEAKGQKAFSLTDQFWVLADIFSGIMIGIGKTEAALDLYGEFDKSGDLLPNLELAMEIFLKLRTYMNDEDLGSSWDNVVDRITTGDAAFGFMGDYARSQILSHGEAAAENVKCSPLPGEIAAFYGVDVFVGFARAPNAAQNFEALQRIILNPKNNAEYVRFKGVLPVVAEARPEDLDHCARNSLAIWDADPNERVSMTARDGESVSQVHRVLQIIWENAEIAPPAAADLMYRYMSGDLSEEDLHNN